MLHHCIRKDFRTSSTLVDVAEDLDPLERTAQRAQAAELCQKTWTKLLRGREQSMLRTTHTSNFGLNSGELLVLAAECLAKNENFEKAEDACEEFFLETSVGRDQFLCRALFVRAQVVNSTSKQGADGVRRRRLAWGYVLEALEVATAEENRPRYDFLVYNAAIVLWDIVYPLLREGAARYASLPLQLVTDALELVDDARDLDLRVRCLRALGLCYDDGEEPSLAAQCLTKAKELASRRLTLAEEAVATSTTLLDEASSVLTEAQTSRAALDTYEEPDEEEVEAASLAPAPVPEDEATLESEAETLNTQAWLEHKAQEKRDHARAAAKDAKKIERERVQQQADARVLEAERRRSNAQVRADACVERTKHEQAKLEQVWMHCAHVGRNDSSLAGAVKGECATLRTKALHDVQVVKSSLGSTPPKDLLNALVALLSELGVAHEDPPENEDDAVEKITLAADAAEGVADAGRCALRLADFAEEGSDFSRSAAVALARRCALRAAHAKDAPASARVKLDLLKCLLTARELDGHAAVPLSSVRSGADKRKQLGEDATDAQKKQAAAQDRRLEAARREKLWSREVEAARLARRVEALKLLDRTLLAAKRLDDQDLIHEGCVAAWNVGLPLLEPHLRKHVHRTFGLASALLEEARSPLLDLRSKLHFEVARCELAADFLAKAQAEVSKALDTDYGTIDAELVAKKLPEEAWAEGDPTEEAEAEEDAEEGDDPSLEQAYALRPLDRFVAPLGHRLALRSNIYEEPDTVEDKALLLMDHALEAPNPRLQRTMLGQVADLLTSVEDGTVDVPTPVRGWALTLKELENDASEPVEDAGDVPPPAWGSARCCVPYASNDADGSADDPDRAPGERKMKRAALWAQVVSVAWEKHRATSRVLAQQGCAMVLRDSWPLDTHRVFVIRQVEAQYALADAFVDELVEVATETARRAADDASVLVPAAWLALGVDANKVDALHPVEEEEEDDDDDEEDEEEDAGPQKANAVVSRPAPRRLNALKRLILGCLVGGIKRAERLGIEALARNGVARLWNLHMHILKDGTYDCLLEDLLGALEEARDVLLRLEGRDDLLGAQLAELIARCYVQQDKKDPAAALCAEAALRHGLDRPLGVKNLVALYASLKDGAAPPAPPAAAPLSPRAHAERLEATGVDEPALGAARAACFFDVIARLEKLGRLDKGDDASGLGEAASALEENMAQDAAAAAMRQEAADKARAASLTQACPPSEHELARLALGDAGREADADALIMRVELYARIGCQALRLACTNEVHRCLAKAIALLPEPPRPASTKDDERAHAESDARAIPSAAGEASPFDGANTPARAWRWGAVAEKTRGSAIQRSVAPGQDKSTQDNLYAVALAHFVRSARHAVVAKEWPQLVIDAAEKLYNCAVPLSGAAVSRRLASSPVRCVLACLRAAPVGGAAALNVEASLLGLLLECFLDDGDFAKGLSYVDRALKALNARARDEAADGETKAAEKALRRLLLEGRVRFLSRLGRSSGAGLKVEGDAATKAQVWATLARTAAAPHQQLSAYQKCLEAVSGRFERVEYLVELAEWLVAQRAPKGDAQTALRTAVDVLLELDGAAPPAHGSQGSVTGSHVSGSRRTKRTGSEGGTSRGTARTGASRKTRATTRSSAGSQHSASSTSGGARLPGAPSRLGAAHYELLVRALAMLGELAASLTERRRWLVLGYHYACALLNTHVGAANYVAAKDSSAKGKAERKAGHTPALLETPDKTPKFPLVSSLSDWASLDLSTDFLDHCRRAQVQKRKARDVLSPKTCAKVPLAAHHLCALADGLQDLGYTAQALAPTACLQLVGYLATTAEAAPALAVLGGCRRARLLLELGATETALTQLRSLGGLGLTAQSEASAPDATDVERLIEQRKSLDEAPKQVVSTEWKVGGLETRHVWCAIASECVALEQPAAAATYLAGAYRHNDAFADQRGAGLCAEVAAAIAHRRGAHKEASQLVMAAQHAVGKSGDVRTWTRTCLHCVKYQFADGNRKAAKALLVKIAALIGSAAHATKEEPALDAVVCWAQLELLLARLDAAEAKERGDAAHDARARLQRILDAFDAVAGDEPHPLYLDALGLLARLEWDEDGNALPTMERALQGAARLYAASWPPRDMQDARGISPPIARRTASLAVAVARARIELAKRGGEHLSQTLAAAQVASSGGSVVATWLAKTEQPDAKEAADKLEAPALERALALAGSAVDLSTGCCPGGHVAALAVLGEAFALKAGRLGRFDGAWDDAHCGLPLLGAAALEARARLPALEARVVELKEAHDARVAEARAEAEATAEAAEDDEAADRECNDADLVAAQQELDAAAAAARVVSYGEYVGGPVAAAPQLPCFKTTAAATSAGALAELDAPHTMDVGGDDLDQNDRADADMAVAIARAEAEVAGGEPVEIAPWTGAAEEARCAALAALARAVTHGLRRGRFDDAGRASCALAETYGVARPLDCACALLLSQSCSSRRYLAGVYRKALGRRELSRQAILTRVLARCGGLWGCGADGGQADDGGFGLGDADDALGGGDLGLASTTGPGAACDAGRACGVVPWLNGGALVAGAPPSLVLARPHEYPAAAAARRHLSAQSGAWRRLDLGRQPSVYDCLVQCGAQPLYVLSITLSPNDDCVYAALCRCGDGAGPAEARAAVSKVHLTAAARLELKDLTEAITAWRRTAERQLMRYADDAGPAGDFVGDLPEARGSPTNVASSNAPPSEDDALDTAMEAFIERTAKWLGPLLATRQMAGALRSLQGEPAGLVLLLDPILHPLPVEAVRAIRDTHLSVSRDFSIHALYGRRAENSVCEFGDTAYVVDPRCEDTGSISSDKPRPTVLENFARYRSNPKHMGGYGEGVAGDDHIASDNEVQEMLLKRNSGGFVWYGPGRAGPPAPALATLSCDGVRMAIIVDRADTDLTQRRRSKLDMHKTLVDRQLEGPLETAALWSLAGAGCVLLNQWATSFHANRLLLDELLAGVGEAGLTLAGALQRFGEADALPGEEVDEASPKRLKARVRCCPALYGLPTIKMK